MICGGLITGRNSGVERVKYFPSQQSECGQRETVNHIVDICPLTKFNGGLQSLRDVDDVANHNDYSTHRMKLTHLTIYFMMEACV